MEREADLPVFVRDLEDSSVETLGVREDPPEAFYHPQRDLVRVSMHVETTYPDALVQIMIKPLERQTLDYMYSIAHDNLKAAGLLPEQRRSATHH